MKYSIVLFVAFCAIYVQGSQAKLDTIESNNLVFRELRGINDIIQAIIDFAQKALNEISSKIQEITSNVQDVLNKLIDHAKDTIEELRKRIEEILDEIAQQNEVTAKCVDAQRPKLNRTVEELNEGLSNCSANAVDQLQQIERDIQQNVNNITDQIIALQDIVKNCLKENNLFEKSVIGCVIEQASEIREKLAIAIRNANEAVQSAVSAVPEISSSAQVCVGQVLDDARQNLQQIVADARECIEENSL